MKKVGCRFFVLLGVLIVPVLAKGQIIFAPPQLSPSDLLFQLPGLDLNFSGSGVVARGMSGAVMGVSGDLSAIGFNPAGLSSLDRPQMSLVYRYNRPGIRNRQFAGGTVSSLDQNNFERLDQVDFGALAAPGRLFGRSFVGSVAYSVFSDQFYADQTSTRAPVTVDDSLTQVANLALSRRSSGKLTGFNLGAATRFGRLSAGASFQIYQGGFSDTTQLSFGPYYVRPSNGQDTSHSQPVVDRQRLGNQVSYRGSSLILGVQAEHKNARLGVAARIPAFTMGESDLFRLRSNMDIGLYDSVFVNGLLTSTGGLLFFSDSRLELPLSLSTGISYRFSRSFMGDFDYTYTNWGAADLKVRRFLERPFSNLAAVELGRAPIGLTSTHQFRFGWEFGFNPGFGQMFIRGGLRNLPARSLTSLTPLYYTTVTDSGRIIVVTPNFHADFVDSFVRDAQGNIIDTISTASLEYVNGREDPSAKGKIWQQFGASLGVGVRWNQVALDVAYDYATFRRNSYNLTSFDGELITSHQIRQHRLFISFTGYFTRL